MFRRLLISVRDLAEAEVVAASGVSIIDFKEPNGGALAPVDESIWQSAAAQFPSFSLSAALGEADTGVPLACKVPPSFQFAKIGPSGCDSTSALCRLWKAIQLPPSVELVPVAYADFLEARSLPPLDVLRCAIDFGSKRLLIDTFTKDGRGLLHYSTIAQLTAIQHLARQANVWWALAGSLTLAEVARLEQSGIQPDCYGVRGDVCVATSLEHQRVGTVDARRVQSWLNRVTGLPPVLSTVR